jgi:hypothetical protein
LVASSRPKYFLLFPSNSKDSVKPDGRRGKRGTEKAKEGASVSPAGDHGSQMAVSFGVYQSDLSDTFRHAIEDHSIQSRGIHARRLVNRLVDR